MRNIVEDDYANTCNGARTQMHTVTKLNQVTHHAQVDAVQTQSGNICTHTHTGEHKPTYLDSVPDWKGNSPFVSLRCFFLSKHQEQSVFASELTPITITRHICHTNFVCHEMYQFSKKPPFIYGAGEMQRCWCMGLVMKEFAESLKFSASKPKRTNAASIFWLCKCTPAKQAFVLQRKLCDSDQLLGPGSGGQWRII